MRSEVSSKFLPVAMFALLAMGTVHAEIRFLQVDEPTSEKIRSQPLVVSSFSKDGQEDIKVTRALPWYGANGPDVRAGRLIEKAEWTLTVFFLSRDKKDVGVVEMLGKPEKMKFAGLHYADFAEKLDKALTVAARLPRVKAENYEARILSVASMNSIAVWLKGKDENLLIPIPQAFEPLEAYKVYSEEEFTKALIKSFPEQKGRKYN